MDQRQRHETASRGLESERAHVNRWRSERDELAVQVEELQRTKVWLYERWQQREAEVLSIQGSRMWRWWMRYHMLRRVVRRILSPVLDIGSSIRWAADMSARVAGSIHVGSRTAWEQLRARTRRAPSPPPPKAAGKGAAAIDLGVRPRVLLVLPYQVYPPHHGGGVRLYNLIRRLATTVDLYLIVFSSIGEDDVQREALMPHCRQLWFHHWQPRLRPDRMRLRPPNAQIFWSEEVADRIRAVVQEHDIDIVQLEHTELGQYLASVPAGVPTLLTEHDVAFRTHQRRLELGFDRRYPESQVFCGSRADVRRIFLYEIDACRAADLVHVMSSYDGDLLARYMPDGWQRLRVAANGVDCASFAPETGAPRRGVLFVGNFQNLPNQDGLEFMAAEVWPLVRRRCPEATLSVVGSHADDRTRRCTGSDGIELIGEVERVEPYYQSHRVMIAPIRAGSGTRLKILEAFAAGIPVVSTTIGAEGIDARPGQHLLVADDAASFANGIIRLLTDDELHESISSASTALSRERYDWGAVADIVTESYAELLAIHHSARRREHGDVGETPRSGELAVATNAPPAPFDPEPLRPRITLPAKPMRGRGGRAPAVLVLGIYLAKRQNNVTDIVATIAQTRSFQVTQRWVALLGEPPNGPVADVTVDLVTRPTPKSAIINAQIDAVDLESFDYVVLCDDDVVLPSGFLDSLLGLQERLEYRIAQPARTLNSYIDLPIVEQHPGLLARQTLFVEQGPVVSFHRSAFDFVFPFDLTSPMGWGLENVWSLGASERGLKMGIIDSVAVDHSMRRPVANYSWDEADRGRSALFASRPHRPTEECFKVVDIVRPEDLQ